MAHSSPYASGSVVAALGLQGVPFLKRMRKRRTQTNSLRTSTHLAVRPASSAKKRATRSASLVIPLLKPQLRRIQWRKKDNHHANATCALCNPTHIRTQKPLFCVWTNTPRISHGRLAFWLERREMHSSMPAITYPCLVCVSLEDTGGQAFV